MAGRKPHEPTATTRKMVEMNAAVGIQQDIIATILEIDPKTLRKHYQTELKLGAAKANAKVGAKLFNEAMNGNITALIFWCKTRMGWSEKNQVDHTSSDGTMTPTQIMVVGGAEYEADDEAAHDDGPTEH